ncbi:MAG TPA: LCP family protein [Solirubrobacteraceae bacterium]|nr:LCP family protein [Solirubrobacteraceae bacterium]
MPDPGDTAAPPQYKLYRTRPKLLQRGSADGDSLLDDLRGGPPGGAPPRRRRRIAPGRVVMWLVLALIGWIALSAALFLVSAALQQDQVSSAAEEQLDGGGVGIGGPQTTLILGSDRRTEETQEPGGSTSGPSRADSILLMRFGGGHSAKLSIPRDTVVDIPGHGRDKINTAYALGGAALTIQTVKRYLGVDVDHVFEVSFANFPALIDAMGGVDYTGGCVVSRINGGFKNGGYTLRLKRGTTHIDGRQALALARTRKNECNPREDDRTRARRQQKILGSMKDQVFSLGGFVRLPLISWNVPKSVVSDMGGPRLMGYALGLALNGDAPTRVLRPSGVTRLPNGGDGLTVSDAEKQAEVRRFLG